MYLLFVIVARFRRCVLANGIKFHCARFNERDEEKRSHTEIKFRNLLFFSLSLVCILCMRALPFKLFCFLIRFHLFFFKASQFTTKQGKIEFPKEIAGGGTHCAHTCLSLFHFISFRFPCNIFFDERSHPRSVQCLLCKTIFPKKREKRNRFEMRKNQNTNHTRYKHSVFPLSPVLM